MNFMRVTSGWYLNLLDIETIEPANDENGAGYFITLRSGHVKHVTQDEVRSILQNIETDNERSLQQDERENNVKPERNFVQNKSVDISYDGYKIGKEKFGRSATARDRQTIPIWGGIIDFGNFGWSDGSEPAGAEPGADGGEVPGDYQAGAHGAD